MAGGFPWGTLDPALTADPRAPGVPQGAPPQEWPPAGWVAPQSPGMPPPIDDSLAGAPGAPQPWPPQEWAAPPAPQAYDLFAPEGPQGTYKPQPLPAEEPPPGVMQAQQKPTAAPPAAKAAKDQRTAPAPKQDPFLAGIGAANQAESAAVTRMGDAKAKALEVEAAGNSAAAVDYQQKMGRAQEGYERANATAKARTQQLWQEAEELAKAKVDPGRMWHDASLPRKSGALVALFLGGMQSAFTGRNGAMDALQQMLDRDMQAQMADLQNKQASIQTRRGLAADDLAAGRDLFDVQAKGAMVFYETVKQQVLGEASKYQSEAVRAEADKLVAQLDEKKLMTAQDYRQQQFGNAMAVEQQKFQQWETRQRVNQGWAGLELQGRQLDQAGAGDTAAAQAAGEKDQRERGIVAPGAGVVFLAPTKEEGKEARTKVAGYSNFKQAAARYEYLVKKFGKVGAMGPTERRELEQAYADLQTIWKGPGRAALGALSEADLKLADRALGGGPMGYTDFGGNMAAIQAVGRAADVDIDTYMQSLGYEGQYSSHYAQQEIGEVPSWKYVPPEKHERTYVPPDKPDVVRFTPGLPEDRDFTPEWMR